MSLLDRESWNALALSIWPVMVCKMSCYISNLNHLAYLVHIIYTIKNLVLFHYQWIIKWAFRSGAGMSWPYLWSVMVCMMSCCISNLNHLAYLVHIIYTIKNLVLFHYQWINKWAFRSGAGMSWPYLWPVMVCMMSCCISNLNHLTYLVHVIYTIKNLVRFHYRWIIKWAFRSGAGMSWSYLWPVMVCMMSCCISNLNHLTYLVHVIYTIKNLVLFHYQWIIKWAFRSGAGMSWSYLWPVMVCIMSSHHISLLSCRYSYDVMGVLKKGY